MAVRHLNTQKNRWAAQQGIRVSRILFSSRLQLGLPSLVFPVISFLLLASLASPFRLSSSQLAFAARLELFRWLLAPPLAFFPIQSSSICYVPLILISSLLAFYAFPRVALFLAFSAERVFTYPSDIKVLPFWQRQLALLDSQRRGLRRCCQQST